jgi:hypothetical protein
VADGSPAGNFLFYVPLLDGFYYAGWVITNPQQIKIFFRNVTSG